MRLPLLTLPLLVATAACSAPPPLADVGWTAACHDRPQEDRPPKQGASRDARSTVAVVRGHYGVPILQKALFWDGNGEVDDFGLGGQLLAFLCDRFAIGAGLNGTVYKTPGQDEFGAEFEGIARVFPFDLEGTSPFLDFTAGWMQTTGRVPPGGTEWNFTFSFGPGLDIPIGPGTSLQLAAIFHHMSNALGRQNDRNPSQNEGRFWAGVAWSF